MLSLSKDDDRMAKSYHDGRPGYPTALFKDAQRICGISKKSHILEVGAGSGHSTVGLAGIAARLTALEPNEAFARLVRKHTKGFHNVDVINTDFGHYTTKAKFRAAFAFMSFHWIKDVDKFEKFTKLLQKNGSLVIVWQYFMQPASLVMKEINDVMSMELGSLHETSKHNEDQLRLLTGRDEELLSNKHFYVDCFKSYMSTFSLAAESYCALLETFSEVESLSSDKKADLFKRIRPLMLEAKSLPMPVLTDMIVCRKNHGARFEQGDLIGNWEVCKRRERKEELNRLLGNGFNLTLTRS